MVTFTVLMFIVLLAYLNVMTFRHYQGERARRCRLEHEVHDLKARLVQYRAEDYKV